MRKITLQEHVTIDNFAADLNGGMDFQQKYSAKKLEVLEDGPLESHSRSRGVRIPPRPL